jgi:hypothetical protein
MQKIQFTCRERLIFSRAPCFSRRCLWQHGSNNRSSHQFRPVPFLMLSRQKVYRPAPSRRSSIHKKTFEFLIALRLTTPLVKASMRRILVAIAICSWLAISNHCAFAALATRTDSTQSECPFHSKPAKSKEPPAGMQCCKILRAVLFATAKSWARDKASFSNVDLRIQECILLAAQQNVASLLLDTGPPGGRSFAELILQRSLPIHAPPAQA